MWEKAISPDKVFELRCKTTCYFGNGAIKKIDDIARELSEKGVDKVIIVTDEIVYKITGAWDYVEPALKKHGIGYVIYDKIKSNPEDHMVDEATKIGKDFGAKAVIGIGGGSPIDAAKSVAVLLEHPEYTAQDLYELKFTPAKALPIIAINTTHGTGTEVDRFAVVSIPSKEYKPVIAYDCIYPKFAIDDPGLMLKLPRKQTIYTAIDAVNHVTEAATTKVASPYSIELAIETVKLVSTYLPKALMDPENIMARYYLLYASTIAGIAFDNALLHLTHALEHPLSGVKPDLPHGLGLAMILPSVVKTIYPYMPEVLAEVYAPIVPCIKGEPKEAHHVAAGIEKWLFSLGVTEKLSDVGFTEDDVEKLTKLAMTTPSLGLLLDLAPVEATKEVISNIYRESLKPLH